MAIQLKMPDLLVTSTNSEAPRMMAMTSQSMAGMYTGKCTPSKISILSNGSRPRIAPSSRQITAKTLVMIDFLACSFSSNASAATMATRRTTNKTVTAVAT